MAQHGQAKVHTVMSEFKRGTLRSGSGRKVKSRKQAIAIALSEARLSRPKSRMPKGGAMSPRGDIGAMRRKECMAQKGFRGAS